MKNSYKIVAYRCPKDNANVTYGQTEIGMTEKWKFLSVDSDRVESTANKNKTIF